MREDHQKERPRKNTAKEGGAASSSNRTVPNSSQEAGDNRTPDKPIGEVAYAHREPAKKKTGEF